VTSEKSRALSGSPTKMPLPLRGAGSSHGQTSASRCAADAGVVQWAMTGGVGLLAESSGGGGRCRGDGQSCAKGDSGEEQAQQVGHGLSVGANRGEQVLARRSGN
jgi:hypothetical protein